MSGKDGSIGRAFSIVVLGNTDREHPIEDAIADAAQAAGELHGFDVLVASGPYYSDGDEVDRKLVEVTAERDQLRMTLEMVLGQFQQAKGRDGMTFAPYYKGTLDFPQMDAARAALAGGATAERDQLRASAARAAAGRPDRGGAEWQNDVITETPNTWYLLWCLHCHPGTAPLPFSSAEERGKWATAHRDGTGHNQWRVGEQPKGQAS